MKTLAAPMRLTALPASMAISSLMLLPAYANAGNGYVERIPHGQLATLNADDGDLLVARAKAGVSEEELTAIGALKALLVKRLGAAGRSTPYMIDVSGRKAQFLNPETRKYETIPFSSFERR